MFFLLVALTGCQGYQQAAALSATETSPAQDTLASTQEISKKTAAPTRIQATASPLPQQPTSTPTRQPVPTTTKLPTATQPLRTTLLFTGVIVPARCVQAAIDEKENPDYPYEEVSQVISQADLAIGTLNATISDFAPPTGCIPTYVLVGRASNADALAQAGFDAMSVATNHIKNCGLTTCGDRAFFETLENLRRVGIAYVGAGNNHNEAMQPIVMTVNGIRFGIVSLGQIEPMAFAGPEKPGIAVLNEENLKIAISQAREVSDVVIAMPHWGPEDTPVPNWIQRKLARQLVEAGADLVVGNHTHVVQAIQEIDGIPVFYGLGNFVFDQDLDDHQQGVILLVHFENKIYTGYELIPVHIGHDGRVSLADEKEAAVILQRIKDASTAVQQNR